jgi:hypothetical protein
VVLDGFRGLKLKLPVNQLGRAPARTASSCPVMRRWVAFLVAKSDPQRLRPILKGQIMKGDARPYRGAMEVTATAAICAPESRTGRVRRNSIQKEIAGMKSVRNHFVITLAFTGLAVIDALLGSSRALAQGPAAPQVAIQPFQAELCTQVPRGGTFCGSKPSSVAVPANRLLVIEYASGRCPRSGFTLSNGEDWAAALKTTAGGTTARHLLHPAVGVAIGNPQLVSAMQLNGFDVTQQTRIYADPGSLVELDFEDLGGLGNATISCNITISGHMVPQ